MKIFIKFYKYVWRYKWSFIGASLLLIISEIIYNFANYFVQNLVDAVNVPNNGIFNFVNVIAGFIGISLLAMVISTVAWTISDVNLFKGARDLRIQVLSHLQDLDFAYHANKKSGSLISLIRRGDGAFFSFYHELNKETLIIIVDFVFIVVAFAQIDYRFVLIILFSVATMLISTFFLLRENIKARTKFNKTEDDISGIIADNLINFETVKFFAKERFERNRLVTKFKEWLANIWGYSFTYRLIGIAINLIEIFSMAFIFYVCVIMSQAGELTNGAFVLVITFTLRFYPQMFSLIFRLREIAKNHTDLEKYMNILDMEPEIKDLPGAMELKTSKGLIEFKNVVFGYKPTNKVLNGFNLTIHPDESVAFVGTSGAGKTTLVKLLLRFYDVNKGEILIDGVNIKNITKSSLRANIGLVPQEPVLFNDTIKYNIGYPITNIKLSEIEKAAQQANLNDFIEKLPEKYATEVGERGIKLSGGQKQRLAIARAFLANTSIVIFDEATSQLDSFSEKLIQDAFWRVAKNKTSIIIAHRLSTVMRADRIIVLKEGKIVEEGTHKQLSSLKNGVYKGLWDMQKGGMLSE